MTSNLLEGVLKQQFTDADGLLTWERKRLVLDVSNLNLLVGELTSEQQTAISLRGVKYAKEWSFSSPVCGFGFDLVWFSGQMWNFMSDEERTCKQWVDAINHAISLCNRASQNSQDQSFDMNGTRPPLPPSHFTRTSNERLNTSGSVDMTMTEIPSPPHPAIGKFDGPPTVDKFPQHVHPGNLQSVSRALPMDSYLPQYEAKRYQNHTSEHSDDEQQQYIPQRSAHPSHNTNSSNINSQHTVYRDSYAAGSSSPYQHTQLGGSVEYHHSQPPVHYHAVMDHQNPQSSRYPITSADAIYTHDASAHGATHRHEYAEQQHIQQDHRYTAPSHPSVAHAHHRSNNQDDSHSVHTDGKSVASRDSRVSAAPRRSSDSVGSAHSREAAHSVGATQSRDPSLHEDVNRSTQSIDRSFLSQQWAPQEYPDTDRRDSGVPSSAQYSNSGSSIQYSSSGPESALPQRLHFPQLSQGNTSSIHSGGGTGAEPPSAYNINPLSSSAQYATTTSSTTAIPTVAPQPQQQQVETQHQAEQLLPSHAVSADRPSAHLLAQEQLLASHAVSADRPSAHLLAQELTTWQAKCQLLETQLERKTKEVNSTVVRLQQLQDSFDDSQREYEQRLDKAREKERQLISETKRDLESKLLRQSNDDSSHYEAVSRAVAAQHQRETDCLREELLQERKRNKQLLEETKKLDEKRKNSLEHSQHELASLREKYSESEENNKKLKKEIEKNLINYEKERNILTEHNNNIIIQHQNDIETLLLNKNNELNLKIKEINEKMNQSLNILNEENKKLLLNQYNNEKIVLINELNKKLQIEIENVRTEERKISLINLEKLKNSFLKRENETSTDLLKLEELHSKRINELNNKINEINNNNNDKITEIQKLKKELIFLQDHTNENNNKIKERMHEYQLKTEKMHEELINSYNNIEEYKNKEKLYKNELINNITKIRMYSAEIIELKTQLNQINYSNKYYNNNIQESELTITKLQTQLDISKNEIIMLENSNKYIENENIQLKKELARSDRLIYGVQMHHPYNNNNTTTTTAAGNGSYSNYNSSMKIENIEHPIASSLSTKHLFRQPLHNNVGFSPATPTTGTTTTNNNNKLYSATISSTAKTAKR